MKTACGKLLAGLVAPAFAGFLGIGEISAQSSLRFLGPRATKGGDR
jgi:hypothetical protein